MIEQLIKEKNYEAALAELKNQSGELACFQRATCYLNLSENEKAIEEVDKIIQSSEKYYYDLLSIKIAALVAIEEDDKAIEILEEELSMPYIPYKYDEYFNNTYTDLLKKRKRGGKDYSPYDMLKDEELMQLIDADKESEIVAMAIYQLQKRNVRLYLEVIKKFMKSKANNYLKTMLIEVLADQDINEDIMVRHGELMLEVNPTIVTPFMEQEAIPGVLDLVHHYNVDNNLTINQDAYDLLLSYLGDCYPVEVDKDEYPYLAGAIYYNCLANYDDETDLHVIAGQLELNYQMVEAYYDALLQIQPIY